MIAVLTLSDTFLVCDSEQSFTVHRLAIVLFKTREISIHTSLCEGPATTRFCVRDFEITLISTWFLDFNWISRFLQLWFHNFCGNSWFLWMISLISMWFLISLYDFIDFNGISKFYLWFLAWLSKIWLETECQIKGCGQTLIVATPTSLYFASFWRRGRGSAHPYWAKAELFCWFQYLNQVLLISVLDFYRFLVWFLVGFLWFLADFCWFLLISPKGVRDFIRCWPLVKFSISQTMTQYTPPFNVETTRRRVTLMSTTTFLSAIM